MEETVSLGNRRVYAAAAGNRMRRDADLQRLGNS